MLRCPRSPLRLRLCLCVLLLLLLLLPGAPGHGGDAGPGPGAEKTGSRWAWPAFQGLQERLRAAGALSRRYWALFSCRVWPEHCEEDEEAPAGPLGKTRSPGPRLPAPCAVAPGLGRRCNQDPRAGGLAASFAVPPN